MGALLVPLLVLVVVLGAGLLALARWGVRRERLVKELHDPATPTLTYRVAEGQDPAVVLAALESDGYVAATDPVDSRVVVIGCPAGPDRERAHVRAVIRAAGSTVLDDGAPVEPGSVRFDDER